MATLAAERATPQERAEFAEVAQAMMEAAAKSDDIAFMQAMIHHHAQAKIVLAAATAAAASRRRSIGVVPAWLAMPVISPR